MTMNVRIDMDLEVLWEKKARKACLTKSDFIRFAIQMVEPEQVRNFYVKKRFGDMHNAA